MNRKHIITIDGPAGSGKSSTARRLAALLGFVYLDTGAMYRSVAVAALDSGIDLKDEKAVGRMAGSIDINFVPGSGSP
jgi:cytidylate kinase